MGELDFFDPEFLADPYPVFHRLRAEDPVHRHRLGFYVLTRFDDVAAFLRDARFGKGGGVFTRWRAGKSPRSGKDRPRSLAGRPVFRAMPVRHGPCMG